MGLGAHANFPRPLIPLRRALRSLEAGARSWYHKIMKRKAFSFTPTLTLFVICASAGHAWGISQTAGNAQALLEVVSLSAQDGKTQEPPASESKPAEVEQAAKEEDTLRFQALMKKIDKGEAMDKKEVDWARATLAAGLAGKKVLMIVTSHAQLGKTGRETGFWMEELAAPYLLFQKSGLAVDIASPKGGEAPTDPASLNNPADSVKAFLADQKAKDKLKATLTLDKAGKHDAYFVVGGHGVLWDLVDSKDLQKLLSESFEDGRVVAAVCHGPAALVNVRLKNGDPLVKGRKVSGFSNQEEKAVGLDSVVPFALESELKSLGGLYQNGPAWSSFAVRDGRLVTGQNPASSEAAARLTLEALREEISKKLDSAKTR